MGYDREEVITLSQRFLNKKGLLVDVSSLTVSFYEQDVEPTDELPDPVAYEVKVPTRTGMGLYEVEFTIPEDASTGRWRVYWRGTLPGGLVVRSTSSFDVNPEEDEVLANTTIFLENNRDYKIEAHVVSVEGDELDVSMEFTSAYDPYCVSYEEVITLIPGVAGQYEEDSINFLIWKYCQEVLLMVPPRTPCNEDLLDLAKRKWVTLSVVLALLNDSYFIGSNLRSKKLGDLHVTYADNSLIIKDLIKKLGDELKDWEKIVRSAACDAVNMNVAQVGINSPDIGPIGRQIREPLGSNRLGNTKGVPEGRNRYQMGYQHTTGRAIENNTRWSDKWRK